MKHKLILLACLGWTAIASGQAVGGPTTKPAKPTGPVIYSMTVVPKAAPRYALAYRLLPSPVVCTPGNAALLYYQAAGYDPQSGVTSEETQRMIDWLATPLEKLPRKEISTRTNAQWMRLIADAAKCDSCDWGLQVQRGVEMRIPTMGHYRTMARIVALKARQELADGQFSQAVETLQTNFAMSQHLSNAPALILPLVGLAVANISLDQVQQAMECPDGPNLYWALASLPRPVVDFRQSMEAESDWVFVHVPELSLYSTGELTPRQWADVLVKVQALMERLAHSVPSNPSVMDDRNIATALMAVRLYPEAKQRLLDRGLKRQDVEAMPVAQVILMDQVDRYLHMRAELFKWHRLAYWQGAEGFEAADRELMSLTARYPSDLLLSLLPTLRRAALIQAQLDRRVAAMMCVEAIRMYAADHGGKPPASLGELSDAPAQRDPITGQDFIYKTTSDNSFVLEGPAPKGSLPSDGVRFEVTISTPVSASGPRP